MYGWCPSSWVYPAEWCVHVSWLELVDHESMTRRKVDLTREYWNNVFQPSLKVWETGGTPNPDVWCNTLAFHVVRNAT